MGETLAAHGDHPHRTALPRAAGDGQRRLCRRPGRRGAGRLQLHGDARKRPRRSTATLRWRPQDSLATLIEDDSIIVSATREPVEVDVPPPPSLDDAQDAEPRFTGLTHHIFPGCFVCGPERGEGDGMRIFPGPLGDSARQVAATWEPDPSLADEAGLVRPEFVWAALDCPGYFAAENEAGMALLGRMSATIHRPVEAGEQLIVTGWPIESEGRKHRVGSALHDAERRAGRGGDATWITLKEEQERRPSPRGGRAGPRSGRCGRLRRPGL